MTTLTIEVPDEAARIAVENSRHAQMTLSEWIALRILGRSRIRSSRDLDELGYPKEWFAMTCGSLADVDDFVEPADRPPNPIAALNL